MNVADVVDVELPVPAADRFLRKRGLSGLLILLLFCAVRLCSAG